MIFYSGHHVTLHTYQSFSENIKMENELYIDKNVIYNELFLVENNRNK